LSVPVAVRYANELHPGKSTHSVEQNTLPATLAVLIGFIAGKTPAETNEKKIQTELFSQPAAMLFERLVENSP
jgi:hypothetical protein